MESGGGEKSPFAKLGQVGVVVKDMDRTIAFLSSMGIGPFEPPRTAPFIKRELRGKPNECKLKIMFARLGDVDLELIQPMEGTSIHQEFLESKGEGIHHLGFYVDDLQHQVDKLAKLGIAVTQRGTRANGGGYAYFETDRVGGITFELVQR